MKRDIMRATGIAVMLLLFILFASGWGCTGGDGEEATPTPTSTPAPSDVSVNASHSGGEITLTVHDSLIVTLGSNPTTGYGWALVNISDESVLQEVSNEFVLDPTPPEGPISGGSGKEIWTFKALSEGTSTLFMEYIQPWMEGVEPGATFNISVTVE